MNLIIFTKQKMLYWASCSVLCIAGCCRDADRRYDREKGFHSDTTADSGADELFSRTAGAETTVVLEHQFVEALNPAEQALMNELQRVATRALPMAGYCYIAVDLPGQLTIAQTGLRGIAAEASRIRMNDFADSFVHAGPKYRRVGGNLWKALGEVYDAALPTRFFRGPVLKLEVRRIARARRLLFSSPRPWNDYESRVFSWQYQMHREYAKQHAKLLQDLRDATRTGTGELEAQEALRQLRFDWRDQGWKNQVDEALAVLRLASVPNNEFSKWSRCASVYELCTFPDEFGNPHPINYFFPSIASLDGTTAWTHLELPPASEGSAPPTLDYALVEIQRSWLFDEILIPGRWLWQGGGAANELLLRGNGSVQFSGGHMYSNQIGYPIGLVLARNISYESTTGDLQAVAVPSTSVRVIGVIAKPMYSLP